MKKIYLDYAATTRVDPRVAEAMQPYFTEHFGNPSSVHEWGRCTKVMIENARETFAEFIGASPSEIYFTSGGTEANNFAIKGLAYRNMQAKNHIITSPIEHPSVLETLDYLNERFGFRITYLDVNKFGEINIEELKNVITENTLLICIMHSNNEIGIINDVERISDIAQEHNIYLHTDCIQSIGKTSLDIRKLKCTAASFSGHKIYAPKGIGALYIKRETIPDKLIHGGKQERNLRGGTENVPYIAGFKKAIEILKENMQSDIRLYNHLRQKLITELKNNFGDMIIFNSVTEGDDDKHRYLPNIINISFNPDKIKIDSDSILINLDIRGIGISAGAACGSGAVKSSHVIEAISKNKDKPLTSLRISFGRWSEPEDTEIFVKTLREIIDKR